MKILVTGGAGFIGSHLCEFLVRRGDEVMAVDNFDAVYPRAYKEANLRHLDPWPTFRRMEVDICNPNKLHAVMQDFSPEVVVHLAARAGVRQSIDSPGDYVDTNILGTVHVLESCRRCGVRRFVFASSSSVYGDRTRVPFREDDVADKPVSPYAATKRAAEMMCFTYHHTHGLHTTCLRFFTVYGPRQRPEMVFHKFSRLISRGQVVPVFGHGQLARDYTHVSDIVDGIVSATDRANGFRVYNLGNSLPHRLDEVISGIEKALGIEAKRELLPDQPGDVSVTYASVERAAAELDFKPKISLEQGIASFVDWYRTEGKQIELAVEEGIES